MTANGIVVALGAAAAAVSWYTLHYPAALVVAVACVVLLAIGLPQRVRRRRPVAVALACPSRFAVRGGTVAVTATAARAGIARIRVETAGRKIAEASIGLRPKRPVRWTTPPLPRGDVRVVVERMFGVDMLALWRWRIRFTGAPLDITVHPRHVALAAPPLAFDPEDGDLPATVPSRGSAFTGLREYQPGDDIRHIDWAASARSVEETVYVRQFNAFLATELSVVLDTGLPPDAGPAGQEAFEAGVDLAYSFVLHGGDLYLVGDPRRYRTGEEAGTALLSVRPAECEPVGTAGLAGTTVVVTAVDGRIAALERAYTPSVPVFHMSGRGAADLTAAQEVWGRWADG